MEMPQKRGVVPFRPPPEGHGAHMAVSTILTCAAHPTRHELSRNSRAAGRRTARPRHVHVTQLDSRRKRGGPNVPLRRLPASTSCLNNSGRRCAPSSRPRAVCRHKKFQLPMGGRLRTTLPSNDRVIARRRHCRDWTCLDHRDDVTHFKLKMICMFL